MTFFHFNREMWGPKFYEVLPPNKRELFYKDFLNHYEQGMSYDQWHALQRTRG